MKEDIRHNKKTNLLALLLVGLFIILGFIDLQYWLMILPLVVAFFIWDESHGRVYQKSTPKVLLDICIYSICLMELISCIMSVYKPNSIMVTLQILLLALFYFFMRFFIRQRCQQKILCIGISGVAGILSLVTLVFFYFHKYSFNELGFMDLTNFKAYYRPLGIISNDWVTILLCFLPFSFSAILLEASKCRQLLYFLVLTLIIIAILVSFSRGAYLSLCIFLGVVMILTFLYKRKCLKKVIMIIGLSIFSACLAVSSEYKSVFSTLGVVKTVSQKRSFEGRLIKWREAKYLFCLSPIVGVGTGNYGLVSENYIKNKRTSLTNRSTNTYLQILVEKGILGMIIYAVTAIVLLWGGFKTLKKDSEYVIPFLSAFIALGIREVTFSSFFIEKRMQMLLVLIMFICVQPVQIVAKYEIFGE